LLQLTAAARSDRQRLVSAVLNAMRNQEMAARNENAQSSSH
jgi:hypothetical protein